MTPSRKSRTLPHRLLVSVLGLLAITFSLVAADTTARPRNIVLIYADDVGWGDLGCYGAKGVRTPNLDRLAGEGIRFTDAHAPSATCTPSRYALMTGQYAWRRKGTGVLPGDAALIIEPGRTTFPSVLQQAGYTTGVVGKWHLGLGPGPGKTDWNGDIKPGPLEVGFDYAFVMPATGDRVPCVFVENHRVVGLDPQDPIEVSFTGPIGKEPTGKSNPDQLTLKPSHGHDMTIVNGVSRIGYMAGGKAARWKDEDMADTFTQKAIAYMERNKDRPFFLYFAPHDIHVPRVPHSRFVGRSTMGPRGDALAQLDGSVGALLDNLERLGLRQDTLVIFSSDNGPVVDDGYQDDALEKLGGHRPAGPWRGGKYSKFEGGTRVPMLVRWPRVVKPGGSDALICHVDFLATVAAILSKPLAPGDAPDSQPLPGALLGTSATGRDHLVEHAGGLAIREGAWKYIPASDGIKLSLPTRTELGNDKEPQLYNLANDPGERHNLAAEEPARVGAMATRLAELAK